MLAIRRFAPARSKDALRQVLADNQVAIVAGLRVEVAAFEARYGIRSVDLATALASGRIEDTEDVCNWVIAWEGLRAAEGAAPGSARLG